MYRSGPAPSDAAHGILRKRLHRGMRVAVRAIPFALPAIYLILVDHVDAPGPLVAWIGFAAFAGAVQWMSYLRRPATEDWTSVAVATQVLGGVVWGLFAWMAMPYEPVWQALVAGLLIATQASSVVFASPLRAAYLAFLVPATFGSVPAFLLLADGDARWAAVLLAATGVFMGLLAEQAHRTHAEAASLTIELQRRAMTDDLTGLANRRAVASQIEAWLDEAGRTPAVLFVDLDGFKQINDRYGHSIGDEVLTTIGARLASRASEGALVGRIGGDEFIVAAPDATTHGITAEIEALERAFDDPIQIRQLRIVADASIGAAIAGSDATLDSLLQESDRAQYAIKRSRRGVPVSPYSEETDSATAATNPGDRTTGPSATMMQP
ncbi:MAG: GGDEF domain-containing protein [Actinomycetota bacterium]